MVLREVALCRFESQAIGNQEFGPASTKIAPDVDLVVSESPQRSASTNRSNFSFSGGSFMYPTRQLLRVVLMCETSLNSFLSSFLDHLVTFDAKSPIAFCNSGRASRASHKFFITLAQATPAAWPASSSSHAGRLPSGQNGVLAFFKEARSTPTSSQYRFTQSSA